MRATGSRAGWWCGVVWALSLALIAGVARHLGLSLLTIGAFVLLAVLRRTAAACVFALLAAGCVGLGWMGALRAQREQACVARVAASQGAALVDLHGWVAGFPRTGPHGSTFEFATRVDGRPVRLEVRADFFDVSYGDRYALRARLLAVPARERAYLASRGLAGRARARLRDTIRAGRDGGQFVLRELFWPLHRATRTRLSRSMGADASLSLGLLLGERGYLGEGTRESIRRLGIAHLLAISGMHLTSIAACVVLLLRRWPRRTVPALFLSLTLYTGMVGDVESLTRAYVMALLLMAAHATIRPARPLDALGRTLMLMTLAAPLSILSAGLQLSCAATFALLVVLPRLRRPDGAGRARAGGRAWARAAAGAARSVRNALVVSAAVEAFIAPLQIHHFGAVSAVGPLATVAFLVPVTVVLLAAIPVAVMPPWVPLADESARALAALSAWTVDLVGAVGVRAPALVALDRPHAVLYYAALAAAWRWRRRWYGWVLGLGGLAAAFAIGG